MHAKKSITGKFGTISFYAPPKEEVDTKALYRILWECIRDNHQETDEIQNLFIEITQDNYKNKDRR